MSLSTAIISVFWMCVIGLSLLVVILVLKVVIYYRIIGYLKDAEFYHEQTVALLSATKAYAQSSRTHMKEAEVARKQTAAELPTRAELAQAVAEVPQRTAEAVVQKIKSGDSGIS